VLPDIVTFDKDPLPGSDPTSDLSAEDLALLTHIEEEYTKRVREKELLLISSRLQYVYQIQV
jgi:hypothetical protein